MKQYIVGCSEDISVFPSKSWIARTFHLTSGPNTLSFFCLLAQTGDFLSVSLLSGQMLISVAGVRVRAHCREVGLCLNIHCMAHVHVSICPDLCHRMINPGHGLRRSAFRNNPNVNLDDALHSLSSVIDRNLATFHLCSYTQWELYYSDLLIKVCI